MFDQYRASFTFMFVFDRAKEVLSILRKVKIVISKPLPTSTSHSAAYTKMPHGKYSIYEHPHPVFIEN